MIKPIRCTNFSNLFLEISAFGWFYYKKFNTMHGHMNVKTVLHIS